MLPNAPAQGSSNEVSLFEVNPTVATGDASLIGRLGEGCPGEGDSAGRSLSRLDARRPSWQDGRRAKVVAAGKALENVCFGGTDGAILLKI